MNDPAWVGVPEYGRGPVVRREPEARWKGSGRDAPRGPRAAAAGRQGERVAVGHPDGAARRRRVGDVERERRCREHEARYAREKRDKSCPSGHGGRSSFGCRMTIRPKSAVDGSATASAATARPRIPRMDTTSKRAGGAPATSRFDRRPTIPGGTPASAPRALLTHPTRSPNARTAAGRATGSSTANAPAPTTSARRGPSPARRSGTPSFAFGRRTRKRRSLERLGSRWRGWLLTPAAHPQPSNSNGSPAPCRSTPTLRHTTWTCIRDYPRAS